MGLFNSSILDVLLGLVFVYFLLSIICSSINEFFAGMLKWRARDLERGIINLIRDPDIVRGLLSNPLITALSSRNNEALLVKWGAGDKDPNSVFVDNTVIEKDLNARKLTATGQDPKKVVRKNYAGKPSYIPSRTFVLALLNTVLGDQPLTVDNIRQNAQDLSINGKNDNQKDLGKILLLLLDDSQGVGTLVIGVKDVRTLVEAMPDSTRKTQILAIIDTATSVDAVRNAVLALDVSDERRAVLNYLTLGISEIEAFKRRAESWYDTVMARVEGVYKRRIQIYLFGIGFLVALIVGADSIHLANALSSNAAVRQSLLADVSRATTPGGDFYFSPPKDYSNTSTVTSTIISSIAVTSTGNMTTTATSVTLPSTQSVVDELQSFGQLFGYDSFGRDWKFATDDIWRQTVLVLGKLLGLVITGFAVSFGAPFWFDLLNKVANLRAAVKPPAEKQASS